MLYKVGRCQKSGLKDHKLYNLFKILKHILGYQPKSRIKIISLEWVMKTVHVQIICHHHKVESIQALDRLLVYGLIVDASIDDQKTFEDDPLAAVAKGWGMLSSFAMASAKLAVKGAETLGKTVNEKVVHLIGYSSCYDCCSRSRL